MQRLCCGSKGEYADKSGCEEAISQALHRGHLASANGAHLEHPPMVVQLDQETGRAFMRHARDEDGMVDDHDASVDGPCDDVEDFHQGARREALE